MKLIENALSRFLKKEIVLRPSYSEIAVFLRQLSFYLDSGINLSEAIVCILQNNKFRTLQGQLLLISSKLNQGLMLSDCMNEKFFTPLLVGMIRAGEFSGSLSQVLNRMSAYYEYSGKVKNDIKNALLYPFITMVLLFITIFTTVMTVIPNYAQIYSDNSIDLPLPTQLLLQFYKTIQMHKQLLLLLGIFIIVASFLFSKTQAGRLFFDYLKINLYPLSLINRKLNSFRFTETLAIMLSSGVLMTEALQMVAKLINNRVIDKVIMDLIQRIEKGESLGTLDQNYFDPLLVSMLKLGEETGKLPSVMLKTSLYFRNDVEILNTRMGKLIEPFLTLFTGGIIAFVMLSLLLPALKLASVF